MLAANVFLLVIQVADTLLNVINLFWVIYFDSGVCAEF